MTVAIRPASGNDLPDLLELMHQFYAESGYPLNVDRARSAFLPLLVPGQLGQVWLADFDGQLAGHARAHLLLQHGIRRPERLRRRPVCSACDAEIVEWAGRWWHVHAPHARS